MYLSAVLPAITSVAASLTFLTDCLVLKTSSSVGCAAFNFCSSRAAIALGYKSSSVTLGSINLLSVPEVNADSPIKGFGAGVWSTAAWSTAAWSTAAWSTAAWSNVRCCSASPAPACFVVPPTSAIPDRSDAAASAAALSGSGPLSTSVPTPPPVVSVLSVTS